jgi:hypothetical protein
MIAVAAEPQTDTEADPWLNPLTPAFRRVYELSMAQRTESSDPPVFPWSFSSS